MEGDVGQFYRIPYARFMLADYRVFAKTKGISKYLT